MQAQFAKYQGAGNDFVIIDNRHGNIQITNEQIRLLCNRRFGIGADGLMLLNSLDKYDFEMVYYNADGAEGSMGGNGGRCITQFAFDLGIRKENYLFLASDGPHEAFFGKNNWIHLKMKNVSNINSYEDDFVLDTGSPHYIKAVDEVEKIDVVQEGRMIRNNQEFKQNGINVNFVQVKNNNILVRTYERGVEDETFSCGTGVTASALVFAYNDQGFNRVEVSTKGGRLAVEFDKIGEKEFDNIWLCGPACYVYNGSIELE